MYVTKTRSNGKTNESVHQTYADALAFANTLGATTWIIVIRHSTPGHTDTPIAWFDGSVVVTA